MNIDLKDFVKKTKKDWEKVLFRVMLVIAFFFIVIFFLNLFFYNESTHELNVTGSAQKSIFGENAFAFLYGVPLLEEEESPFTLEKSFPKSRRRPKPKPKNNWKPKPKPKPVKEGYMVKYNGWLTIASGEKVAFVKVFDLRTKKLLKSNTVQVDESVSGFTIKTIEEDNIIIEDQDGNTNKVPIYKQITIMGK